MKKTRKKLKKVQAMALALVMLSGAVDLSGFQALAAENVEVTAGDVTSYSSLNSAWPGVFQYTEKEDGSSGQLIGMAITQNSGTGTYIASPFTGENTGQLTSTGLYGWSAWFEDCLFSSDGDIVYCFDYGTGVSGTRTYVTFDELGLSADYLGDDPEGFVLDLAKAAYGLTYNNFVAITDNASSIAEGYSNSSYTITQANAQAVLESTSDLADEVKRLLIQNMIWVYMNDIETDAYHSGYATSGSGSNKDGSTYENTYTSDTVSITSVWDMEELYEIGLEAYGSISGTAEYEYFLEYGESITLTGDEAEDVWTVYEEYGYLGSSEAADVFTVTKDDDGSVTITCVKAADEQTYYPSETGYLYAEDVSSSYSAGDDAQFVVNVEAIKKIGVRIGTIGNGFLSLKKSSEQTSSFVTDNSSYSLAGAVYRVYSDASCLQLEGELTTDSDGSTDTLELSSGTYYVKEYKASPGYIKDTEVYTVSVEAGKTTELSVKESADEGVPDIMLYKVNEDKESGSGLGGAVFKAVYSYTDNSGSTVSVTNYYITDSDGKIDLSDISYVCSSSGTKGSSYNNFLLNDDGNICVYAGSLTVSEYKAPEGYLKTTGTLTVTYEVSEDGTLEESVSGSAEFTADGYVYDETIRGGVVISKADADSSSYTAQGDASLEGAVIKIVNNSGRAVYMAEDDVESGSYIEYVPDSNGDDWYEDGETMLFLTAYYDEAAEKVIASADGNGDGECYTLPYGSYYAAETKASEGYLVDDDWYVEFDITENGVIVDITDEKLEEPVIRGGVYLQKNDLESGLPSPLGGSTLKGAVYTIINLSDEAVYVTSDHTEDGVTLLEDENGDGWFESGEAILTITTDSAGYATMDTDGDGSCRTLPYGTYLVLETSAPLGYLKEGVISLTFSVRQDGYVYALDGTERDDSSFYDQVIRGDFEFTKKNEDSEAMAGVLFKITSDTTGETHYFVTDENGYFTSSWDYTSHTIYNANKNDEAVTENADGTITVDESLLSSAYGIWFGEGTEPDESLCALPYDTYTITEIKTSANEGYTMRTFTVTIAAKDTGEGEDTEDPEAELECADLGTIYNTQVVLDTKASCYEDGSQFSAASSEVTIVDTVTLTGGTKNREYTVKCVLIDGETGEVYEDKSGNTYSKTYTVTGKGPYLEVSKDIIFYDVDLTGTEGGSIVIFTYIYDGDGNLLLEEEDLSDRDETVYIYGLETMVADTENGTHVSSAAGSVQITDTVVLTNLKYRQSYTVYGVLHYAEDFTDSEGTFHAAGDAVTDADGNAVTASASFKTSTSDIVSADDGYAVVCECEQEITFEFDAGLLDGACAVVYTYLYEKGSELIDDSGAASADGLLAWGTDIDNEDETIHFPKISTSALDILTGDRTGTTASETSVTDKVTFENLAPGYTYKLIASVYDEDGNELSYTGGAAFTLNADFTLVFEDEACEGEVTYIDEDKKSADGYIYVSVSGILAGQGDTYTVTQTLYIQGQRGNWYEAGRADDLSDEDETIHYPLILTIAADGASGDDVGAYSESAEIVDTVYFENLIPGYEYTITGSLYDRKTEELLVIGGQTFTAAVTFTVNEDGSVSVSEGESGYVSEMDADGSAACGYVTVTFTGIDSDLLSGGSVVVYETLIHNETEIALHQDISDDEQTVHYPSLDTEAADLDTGDHAGTIFGKLINGIRSFLGNTDADKNGISDDAQQNIVDTVTMENLVPGRTYTVSGILMDKETGQALTVGGKTVTQTAVFTVSEDGKSLTLAGGYAENLKVISFDEKTNSVTAVIEMVYSFDSSLLDNTAKTIVTFETLYHNNVIAAVHHDIEDEDQSVYELSIDTSAADLETKDQAGVVSEEASVIDTISLEGLVSGQEYTVTGRLIDQSETTNEELVFVTDDEGNEITHSLTFTAQADTYEAELIFTFDSTEYQGKAVTVLTEVYHNDILISLHGYSYDDDGNISVEASESIYYPAGKTNAADDETAVHLSDADETTTITDLVYFQNLISGEEYTITGTLHYAEDFTDSDGAAHCAGEAVTVDGKEITQSVSFTASSDIEGAYDITVTALADGTEVISGYIPVTFTVNTSALAGAAIVAFEDFYHNGVKLFAHADITDLSQTIRIPAISTSVSTDEIFSGTYDEKTGEYSWNVVTIVDTVSYENLWTQDELDTMHSEGLVIEGGAVKDLRDGEVYDIFEYATYAVSGYLVYAQTGEPVYDTDGNMASAYTVFTPDSSDGTVEVIYTLDLSKFVDEDGNNYLEGADIVVFEDLYHINKEESNVTDEDLTGEDHIAEHKDINDKDQTFKITALPDTDVPDAGDSSNFAFWIMTAVICLALAAIAAVFAVRRISR